MTYLYNGILFCNIKKQTPHAWCNWIPNHYAQWKKPDTHILWFLLNNISEKEKSIEQKLDSYFAGKRELATARNEDKFVKTEVF